MVLEQIRLQLHEKLCKVLDEEDNLTEESDVPKSYNCYYSPPTGFQMKYPCIVYSLTNELSQYADNSKYLRKYRWSVTVIDRNPDSEIVDRMKNLSYCSFDRSFTTDNLYHFVYTLFY